MTREDAIHYLTDMGISPEHIMELIEALGQEPCEDAISRGCNNCAYYDDGANDEACDGCFEDEYEHPNFRPKMKEEEKLK